MTLKRKEYDTKCIAGHDFCDYWDLKAHPLFISFSKENKPLYMHFDEEQFEDSVKIASLTDIRDALSKNNWAFEEKYWKTIQKHIQTMIDIPWTQL